MTLTLTLGAPAAWAHSSFPGINQFYNGLLHPLVAPAHLLGLLALALLAGQQSQQSRPHEIVGLCVGLLLGALCAGVAGDPDTDRALWVATVFTGLLVVLKSERQASLRLGTGGLIGVAVGLASADISLNGSVRMTALIGASLGSLVLVGYLALLIEAVLKRWSHRALRIGLRVLGSWITACALLMAVLEFKRTV